MSKHEIYALRSESRILRFIDGLEVNHPQLLQRMIDFGQSILAIIFSIIIISLIIISQIYS